MYYATWSNPATVFHSEEVFWEGDISFPHEKASIVNFLLSHGENTFTLYHISGKVETIIIPEWVIETRQAYLQAQRAVAGNLAITSIVAAQRLVDLLKGWYHDQLAFWFI